MNRKAPWICQADDCMHVNKDSDMKCRQCGEERPDVVNVHPEFEARTINVSIDGGGADDMTLLVNNQGFTMKGGGWRAHRTEDFTTMHGHVVPRQDGQKARCGGPGLCSTCDREFVVLHRKRMEAQGKALMDAATGVDVSAAVELFATSHTIKNVLAEIGKRLGVTFIVSPDNVKRIELVEGGGDMWVAAMYTRDEHGRVGFQQRPLAMAPEWIRTASFALRQPDRMEQDNMLAALVKAAVEFTEFEGDMYGGEYQERWAKLEAAALPFCNVEYPPR